ncbi:hypothetical protein FQA39_LY15401 [Lamprigera yunnana]|nr:hypothetical protein FQA39_LY15401 [Lamprigera yunnana]
MRSISLAHGRKETMGWRYFENLGCTYGAGGLSQGRWAIKYQMKDFESGNDPAEYEFYETVDEILGLRPTAQQGFDSSQPEEVTLEELYTMEEDDARISLEMYDDDPDIDGAIPGGPTTPGMQKQMQQPLVEEKGVPYVKPVYLLGNLTSNILQVNSIPTIVENAYRKHLSNRYVGIFQFTRPTLIICDPELIKEITIKNFESFSDRQEFFPSDADSLWGKNLFQLTTKNGWHNMRAALSPSFTGSKMKWMFNLMDDCVTQFVDHFKNQNKEVMFEVKDIFSRFANDVISSCAFGIQCNSLKYRDNEFYTITREATDFSGIKELKFMLYEFSPMLIKLLNIKIFSERVSNLFRSTIKQSINFRESNNIVRPDMIHLLLETRKKLESLPKEEKIDGMNTLSDEDITAQALIFLFAGFDTVSTAICYLAYDLATHPEIQQELYREITEALEKSPKISYETLNTLEYLNCVLSESLRLHPPEPVHSRMCTKPITIAPTLPSEKPIDLVEGVTIWFPSKSLHLDEQYFPNPQKFDPERFNAENKSKINPYVYSPFGSGPRNCIGSRFALMEIKLLIVEILKNFEIVPNENTEIPLRSNVVNFDGIPTEGIWMSFKSRI